MTHGSNTSGACPTLLVMQERRRHPHFDDRGTLNWHTSFAGASAQARAEGKWLFIEFGREL